MSVKSIVAERLEKARSFADSARAIYERAYSSAVEMRESGVNELVKDIQPRVRGALEESIRGAKTALDELNQSLADKAIPSFRKGAVSREQLEKKAKKVKVSGAKTAVANNKAPKKAQSKK